MRSVCSAAFAIVLAWSVGAHGETLAIHGMEIPYKENVISKSTSARIVDVFNSRSIKFAKEFVKGVYLPAGTRLVLLDSSYRKDGATWHLAVTEDGLLVHIKRGNYFPESILTEKTSNRDSSLMAVIREKMLIRTENYGSYSLSPSETYAVSDPDGPEGTIEIILDQALFGTKWTIDEKVRIPSDKAKVLSVDAFDDVRDWKEPFRKYDALGEAWKIVEEMVAERTTDKEKWKAFLSNLVNVNFIEKKECGTTLKFGGAANAELGVDVSPYFSPITAKLSLTGNVSSETTYAATDDFDIRRAARSDYVYELRVDRTRTNCSSAPTAIRTTISGSDGVKGEITGGDLASAEFQPGNVGFVLYTCSDEYFRLINLLTNRYRLPMPLATFVVAHFGEFRGAATANVCKATVAQPDTPPTQ